LTGYGWLFATSNGQPPCGRLPSITYMLALKKINVKKIEEKVAVYGYYSQPLFRESILCVFAQNTELCERQNAFSAFCVQYRCSSGEA
jgi:glycine cleavage system regulatory protein